MGEQKPEKTKKHICAGLLAHVTADEYLSGNVRRKLRQAQRAAQQDPGGPPGRLSGHGRHGAGTGHHHLLQTGGVFPEGHGGYPVGHAGPCGLLR